MAYGDGYAGGYAGVAEPFPVVVVEAAWAYDPDSETPTFVEVPNWRSIDISRGRQRELDTFSPGTMTVVSSDRDRELDPTNELAANLIRPVKRIRCKATYNGVTYNLFDGYIDSIDHAYAGPPHGDVTATVTATDGFKLLAAAELPSSSYAYEVEVDSPVHWWRLGEPQDETVVFDQGSTPIHGIYQSGVARGGESAPINDPDTSATFDAAGDYLSFPPGAALPAPPYTLEMWLRYEGGTPATDTDYWVFSHNRDSPEGQAEPYGRVRVTSAGVATVRFAGLTGSTNINDGGWHHVALVAASTSSATLYVDGVSDATGDPQDFLASAEEFLIGYPTAVTSGFTQSSWRGSIDEIAIYNSNLSAARIDAHFDAGDIAWRGDSVTGRFTRILSFAQWPLALRDVDTGSVTLQSAELGTALEHLQNAATSDFGALFMSADGKVTFIEREALWNRPSEGTFGDDPADPTELGYRSIRPEFTDALIRNDVTVSRANGKAQRVQDTPSLEAYGRHSHTVDGLWHDDDLFSLHAAEFVVSEYAEPRRRISDMVVTPMGDPADLFPQVLGRELLDVVTVIDRPAGGTLNEGESSIEGITHRITPMWWETTWNLTPAFGTGGTGACMLELDTGTCGLGTARIGF